MRQRIVEKEITKLFTFRFPWKIIRRLPSRTKTKTAFQKKAV
jgi:hypothetical protein